MCFGEIESTYIVFYSKLLYCDISYSNIIILTIRLSCAIVNRQEVNLVNMEKMKQLLPQLAQKYKEVHDRYSCLYNKAVVEIIIRDLQNELNINLAKGNNTTLGLGWVQELLIDESGVNFIVKEKCKYYQYTPCITFDGKYNFSMKYKGEYLAFDYDTPSLVQQQLSIRSLEELKEIVDMVQNGIDSLTKINGHISNLENITASDYVYEEIKTSNKYSTIADVIEDYKSR